MPFRLVSVFYLRISFSVTIYSVLLNVVLLKVVLPNIILLNVTSKCRLVECRGAVAGAVNCDQNCLHFEAGETDGSAGGFRQLFAKG
jgi:hypothetical protein